MPKLLDIRLYPDPILREISEKIEISDLKGEVMQELMANMDITMKSKDGAGLAAPQIGKSIRLIVINQEGQSLFLINPEITKKSWARIKGEEGCLSVINKKGEIVYDNVTRHKKINCIYLDQNGKKQHLSAEGDLARVIQHEIDHLNGVLFIDYLDNLPADID